MENVESKLQTPEKFPFPFEPYCIQNDFMKSLYEALEGKKLGIFESPTGTGKSMSLICGSLRWLLDAQERIKTDVELNIKKLDREIKNINIGKDWLEEHAAIAKFRQKKDSLQFFREKIRDMENRIQEIKIKASHINEKNNRRKKLLAVKSDLTNKENQIGTSDDYYLEDIDILLDDFSSSTEDTLKFSVDSSDSEGEGIESDKYSGIKVFMCSRTHSQLAQLVKEVQKSPYNNLNIRVVSLASRQNYCINKSVLSLKHLPLINERCQDLHSKKKETTTKASVRGEKIKRRKTTAGCPYYNQSNVESLKLKTLTEILDVEEMIHQGEKLNGCPYYASRQGVCDAQLIFLPYNILLHKATRQVYGIDLKHSIVIIDEAHNLLDSIENIYSCSVTGYDLIASHSQLIQYRDKFSERFSPLNLLHLNQLIFTIGKFLKKLGGSSMSQLNAATEKNTGTTLEPLADFILSAEIDTINFFKVLEFISKTNIVNKMRGFAEKYKPSVVIHKKKEEKGISAFLKKLSTKTEFPEAAFQEDKEEFIKGNPILSVVSFIQCLTNHGLDGRIVCNFAKTLGASSMKYLLLNPAAHFSDVVKDARSVILAGGTMQPISEFTEQLFNLAGGTPDRISVFTCGHIVPEDNILPIAVSSGPTGKTLDFSFQYRTNLEMVDELGRLLVNVCNVVPAGVVCFFSSYDYENFVFQYLMKTKVIAKLELKKKVVREPRKSNELDEVLMEYSIAVSQRGALLFSVVGGKLSEGLNFNDDLGRCVIVVGLPYPNMTSPELKEKMRYLDQSVGPTAGKTYYENLCMKAVNQSIGRSVRHKNDYASVLLIDQRFSTTKCSQALPHWILKSLHNEEKFGSVIKLLARFFARKKKSDS